MSDLRKENLYVEPGAGEESGTHLVTKVHTTQLNNEYSVMEGVMQPGSLLAPHTHQREDQVVAVLTGELEFEVGGEGGLRFTAKAGGYVIKPRGAEHTFWNATDEPVRYIELSGGPGFQGFIDASTELGSVKASRRSEAEYEITWSYHRIPKLMVQHCLTSISGVETPWEALKDKSPKDIIDTMREKLQGAIG